MRCPRCRSEVGSQKLCPYCGSPMFLSDVKQNQASDTSAQNRMQKILRNIDYRISEIERKLRMTLVLESGILVLLILILTAILIK